MTLIKADILLVNVNTLVKLNLLKSCVFFYKYMLFHDWKWVTPLDKYEYEGQKQFQLEQIKHGETMTINDFLELQNVKDYESKAKMSCKK